MTYDPNASGQGQPYGSDPYNKDPYGGQQPTPPTTSWNSGQPQPGQDPTSGAPGYGTPAADPYGQPQQPPQADPYGQPQQPPQSDPYGQSQPPQDQYGQQPAAEPYGQPTTYGQQDPYGQQSAPPYGQQDPYGQPAASAYGQPSGVPYGQASSPPYGQASAPPYGQPGYGAPPPPPKSRGGLIITLSVVGVVLLLLLCGGGGFLIYKSTTASPKPNPTASGGPGPSQGSSPSPSAAATHGISTRAEDPRPVTVSELFGMDTVVQEGRSYTKLGAEASPTCTFATSGTATIAMAKSNCSQVLRATYTDSTRKYVATVGIANMLDEASASSVGQAIFADPNKGFWTPLKVAGGPAANFNNTAASVVICSNRNRGHYIGWSIVARADGATTNTTDPTASAMGQALLANITLILNLRQ
ncbi:hypothetical protein [Fodinicola feengrottensis]|uniref:Uncharacterized protein n=1 Tax=Fodinicola feengrottensis TaxID=435914 RepID=A0ABN2GBC5_9ACTN|nr:hypothetical protein [Fodinicola feengrottensis]